MIVEMPSDGGLDGVAIERFHHAEHQVAFGCFHLKPFRSGDELVFVRVKELCLENSFIHSFIIGYDCVARYRVHIRTLVHVASKRISELLIALDF